MTTEKFTVEETRYLLALKDLAERREPISLQVPAIVAFHVVAALQLAARHPQITEDLALMNYGFVGQVQTQLEAINPVIGELIDRGWNQGDDFPIDPATGLAIAERTCRVCKCTDRNCSQCIEKTGEPCFWVAADLCSACIAPKPS